MVFVPLDKIGTVRKVTGLIIEAEGPEASIGQVCSILLKDMTKLLKLK